MNKHQLLDMMGSIRDKYVLEAVESRKATFPQAAPKARLRIHRLGLLTAVLAMLMLLAGCVAVYLRLQDMSIGKETYVQNYDKTGKAIEPTEKVLDVINFAALMDSPAQKASTQWHEFTQSYDPDHALMTNEPDIPGIANNYEYIYDCYTQEMADKLDEIAHENQVKLLEARVPIQSWQNDAAMEALGKESLFREDAPAEPTTVQGMLYAPYNFRLMYSLTLTGEEAPWKREVYVTEIYQHSGYLPCDSIWTLDLSEYQQWNYTTKQGIEVLLAINSTGRGLMVCPKDAGVLIVSIDGNLTGSQYPEPDQVPGKEAMEAFAEVIDFDLTPSGIDPAVLQSKLDEAQAEYQERMESFTQPEEYTSYLDYLLKKGAGWTKTDEYAFYDMDGDGVDDLLLGKGSLFDNWLSLEDGKVEEHLTSDARLCQGGMIEFEARADFTHQQRYRFFPLSEWVQRTEHFSEQCILAYWEGQWYTTDFEGGEYFEEHRQPITQEEADAIRTQYSPIELNWKKLWDFPMDDTGKTLGGYYTSLDERPSSEELRNIYAEYVRTFDDPTFFTHYGLMDVNGDGTEDLLLSVDEETFDLCYTYRYGMVRICPFRYGRPCTGGVWENTNIFRDEGVEVEEHIFSKVDENFQWNAVAYAGYNKATASWQSDRDGTSMSAADAEAILAKYPRIDQGMRPISELIG